MSWFQKSLHKLNARLFTDNAVINNKNRLKYFSVKNVSQKLMKIGTILFKGLKIDYKTQIKISSFKSYWIFTASTETEQGGIGP